MVRGEGLVCCATHEPGDKILNEPQACVDRLNTLGCTITAYPYPSGVSFDTYESIKAFCAKLNAAGKVFRDAGMQLCYHNHQIEFRKVNGRIVLDIIYAETDPACLLGEIDTYWVQTGGGDCVEWCRKLKNRQPIIHLKDYGIDKESKPFMAEIGNGNLDFKAITAVAEAGGCKWYSVEQDVCPADPFDSLKQSFEYIRQNLVS